MSSSKFHVSTQDRVAAYLLAIDSLPRPSMWYAAVSSRTDGSTPSGVFAALDELRMEYQIRIGELLETQAGP